MTRVKPIGGLTAGVVGHWGGEGEGFRPGELRSGISVVLCTYARPASVRRFLDSLLAQTRRVDELIVVDAGRDGETEDVVSSYRTSMPVQYWRVDGPLRGLTRQRNFGLDLVSHDLVAFFDDDVVLGSECITEMERAHRRRPDLVGVGCFAETWIPPTRLWRLRQALRVVPNLRPGTYTPSGMSVPWRFHAPTDDLVEGDWLPGCAMMLKTEAASNVRFDSVLTGYALGEDLDFSLRLRASGRIAVIGSARCQHFHEAAGRPDAFKLGIMEISNRYRIWRGVYRSPRLRERGVFAYAWAVDTLLLIRDAVRPQHAADGIRRIAGRVVGASHILMGRS